MFDPALTADCPRAPGTLWPEDRSLQDTYVKSSAFSAEPIFAGLFVVRGVSDGDQDLSLPALAADITARPRGVVMKSSAQDWRQLSWHQYEAHDCLNYLSSGKIWVPVESPVSDFGAVFVRFATGSGSQRGAIRGDSDGGTCAPAPKARFRTSGSKFALVEINLP